MILKPSYYNDFQCTADQCPYTCCCEWNIDIDDETYETYKTMENGQPLLETIEEKNGKHVFILDAKSNACQHLDERGLCKVVLSYGQQFLCKTCQKFPRTVEKISNGEEHSLSNACPHVLEMLLEIPAPLSFVVEEDEKNLYGLNESFGIRCRNHMIDMMQFKELPIWVRLFLIFRFSKQLSETSQSDVQEQILAKYQSADYLLSLGESVLEINCDYAVKMKTLADIFHSVNCLFENQMGYQKYISELVEYVNSQPMDILIQNWDSFEAVLQTKEDFLENFCVNYLFSSVLHEERLIYSSIPGMVLEYIMIKFTLYLRWLFDEKQLLDDRMIGICTYYSRNMNHNLDNVRAFMEEESEKWFGQGGIFILLK